MPPALLTITRAMQLYQVLRLGSVILTSILLAKSDLGMAGIGAYEALMYIGSVAAFFWANGLLQGIPPVYARLAEAGRKPFIFNLFLIFGSIAALIAAALWLGRQSLVPALTGLPEVPHLGWFCAYLFFNLAALPVEYLYLLQERPRALAGWAVASFGLQVLVLALPVYAGWGLGAGLAGVAVLGALRFAWALVLAFRHGKAVFRPDLWRRYLGFSAPLVLNLLVGNLVLLFDAWLVGWYFHDEAVFALFRYGSREFPLATALATALGTALTASLTAYPAEGRAALKAKSRTLFHTVFPPSIALLFLSGPLFPLVFSSEFAPAAPLFNIYLLLTASRVLLPNSIVLAAGRPDVLLRVGLLELVLKIPLGFCFVHCWGLPGVAWSAVAVFFLEKIALIWYLEKRLGVRTEEWLDWRWYAGYVAALGLGYGVC